MSGRWLARSLGFLVFSGFFAHSNLAQEGNLPSCPGFGISSSLPIANIDVIGKKVGCSFGIFSWFQDWYTPLNVSMIKEIISKGAVPQLSLQPQYGLSDQHISIKYKDIAEGKEDTYLNALAESIRSLGKTIYISFAPEMNGDWASYSFDVNNSPQDFIAAYRYIHNFFTSLNLPVKFIWTPNIRYNGDKYGYREFYPGDQYVDIIGLDGYNWGTTKTSSRWTNFDETFGPSYNEIVSFTKKPIQLSEISSAETGGNKAQWITNMCETLPKYEQIINVIWFNFAKEADWRIDSSKGSLDAFSSCMKERINQPK